MGFEGPLNREVGFMQAACLAQGRDFRLAKKDGAKRQGDASGQVNYFQWAALPQQVEGGPAPVPGDSAASVTLQQHAQGLVEEIGNDRAPLLVPQLRSLILGMLEAIESCEHDGFQEDRVILRSGKRFQEEFPALLSPVQGIFPKPPDGPSVNQGCQPRREAVKAVLQSPGARGLKSV